MHRLHNLGLFLAAVIVLVAVVTAPASARVYIDINQPYARKIPLAVPDFTPIDQGASAPGALTKDLARFLGQSLDLTGLFIIMDPSIFLGAGQDPLPAGEAPRFREWLTIGTELLITGEFRQSGDNLILELRLYDVFEKRQLAGKRYTATFADRFYVLSRFMNEVLLALTGERGMFGTTIAFVGRVGKFKEVFTVKLGQPEARQLTRDRTITLSPVFSRKGDELAYISYRKNPGTQREQPHLYVRHLSDGAERRVSSGPNLFLSPCFTADGLLVAISKPFATNIHLLDRAGREQRQVTVNFGINISPTLSPDGKRMVFVSDVSGHPQLYVMPIDGGEPQRITFEGNYNTEPRWSPRGDRILYVGKDDGRFNIYTIKPDGSDRQQLTSSDADDTSPCWSPGGRLIVFSSTRSGASRLYTMTANGDRQRPLPMDFQGEQFEPAWSSAEPD